VIDADLLFEEAALFIRATGRRVFIRRMKQSWKATMRLGDNDEIVVLAKSPMQAMSTLIEHVLRIMPSA